MTHFYHNALFSALQVKVLFQPNILMANFLPAEYSDEYPAGSLPPKSFTEKKLQLFQIKIFFDDDFRESVKVTNVQKCDFSQS